MEPERDELGRVCGSDGGVIPEDYRIEERDDDGDEDEKVEVTFQDGSTRTFDKGVPMRQIWHEYAD